MLATFSLWAALPAHAKRAAPAPTHGPGASPPAARGWSGAQRQSVLGATLTVRLAPDLTPLADGERRALDKLLAAGHIVQQVYELQLHRDAPRAARLAQADADSAAVYRLFHGPIATTLQNQREPFLGVEMAPPGGNVYPWDLRKPELDAYLAAHPAEAAALTDLRSVVARATAANLRRHLAALRRHPVLAALHPALPAALTARLRRPDPRALYAVPYAIEYADQMAEVSRLLFAAADDVQADDGDFARYLRNRARDLLSNDYESGDASWVTGRFRNLNAQIGAYETYDDRLLGTRAYYSLSILVRRKQESDALAAAMRGLQTIERSLPYERHKTVRESNPVGVYDVVADFGQARSANTASILPNEDYLAARYGRTILLRANILRHPDIFQGARALWTAATAPAHAADLTIDGNFYYTLWHEVGHYLGVATTVDGRSLDVALAADGNLLEELKADLVSLFAARGLRQSGYYDDAGLRAVYAAGILRVLQAVRPRRDQPYQSMQLMQWNYFLDKGLLRFDAAAGTLSIDYARYHDTVASMLREVLAVQSAGDRKRSEELVSRYSSWSEDLHGRIAAQLRGAPSKRFRLMRYAALGE